MLGSHARTRIEKHSFDRDSGETHILIPAATRWTRKAKRLTKFGLIFSRLACHDQPAVAALANQGVSDACLEQHESRESSKRATSRCTLRLLRARSLYASAKALISIASTIHPRAVCRAGDRGAGSCGPARIRSSLVSRDTHPRSPATARLNPCKLPPAPHTAARVAIDLRRAGSDSNSRH